MNLTTEQSLAVSTKANRACVIAGAGTGKTTVLVERIKRLLQSNPPSSIAAFTFTRRAARELQLRLGEAASGCLIGTFHAIAHKLHPHRPIVLTTEESDARLHDAIAGRFSGSIGTWRRRVDEYRLRAFGDTKTVAIAQAYESRLRIKNETDYLGLLLHLREASRDMRLHHVLVDEAQDNEPIQWEIVDNLVSGGANGFYVGDATQSIYEWRGAIPSNFLARASERVQLTHSYRLPLDVCWMANSLARSASSDAIQVTPHNGHLGLRTGPEVTSAFAQILAAQFKPSEIAVLCRTNAEVSQITAEIQDLGLPVTSQVGPMNQLLPLIRQVAYPNSMQDVSKIRDMLIGHPDWMDSEGPVRSARLNHWLHSSSILDVESLVSAIKFKFKSQSLEKEIYWLNNFFVGFSFSEAVADIALSSAEVQQQDAITVCTIHQSKGLEWPAVVLHVMPSARDSAENTRVDYVGVTRCKQVLCIPDGSKLSRLAILAKLNTQGRTDVQPDDRQTNQ